MPDAVTAPVGRLPREFWFLWFALVVNRTAKMVLPFLTLYLIRERGLSGFDVGLVLAMHGVGELVAGLLSGPAAARIGRKRLMVVSLLLTAAVTLWLSVAEHMVGFAVGALLLSSVTSLYGPAANALVGEMVSPSERYRAFSLLHWAANIGWGVAPLLAGFLAERSYTLLFLGETMVSIGCAVLVALTVTDRPVTLPSKPANVASRSGFPLHDRAFLGYCSLAVGVGVLFAQASVALPLYLGEAGIEESSYGQIVAVNGAIIVLFQPLLSRYVPRLPSVVALVLGPLLTGLGFGMHGLGFAMGVQIAAVAVWSFGEIVWSPTSQVIVANFAEGGDRVRYHGLFNVFAGISALLGPPIGAGLLALLGTAFWPLCIGIGVFVSVGFVLLRVDRMIKVEEPEASVEAGSS